MDFSRIPRGMANRIFSGLIFCFLIAMVLSAKDESCSYKHLNYRYLERSIKYKTCSFGCCGTYNYRYCCGKPRHSVPVATSNSGHISTIAIIGIAVGCTVMVITISAFIICCIVCAKRQSLGTKGVVYTSNPQGTHVAHVDPHNQYLGNTPVYPVQQFPQYPLRSDGSSPGPAATYCPSCTGSQQTANDLQGPRYSEFKTDSLNQSLENEKL